MTHEPECDRETEKRSVADPDVELLHVPGRSGEGTGPKKILKPVDARQRRPAAHSSEARTNGAGSRSGFARRKNF